uniref:PDZ domain-containing protein n=1 Tax=Alexandrium catenella TaxID=2925 RepID=A0A7S1MQV3_ALECA|mmetsp:Transcript_31895/g.86472  ORF Transcript_31895/g.86472 Transcript_31895/m.86472 type:complete len:127 (+) Transcript_31895:84-464(+)
MGAQCCSESANGEAVTVDKVDVVAPPTVAEEQAEEPAEVRLKAALLFTLKDGSQKTVEVEQQPLGVRFSRESPLQVLDLKPDGVGAEAKIEPGWLLMAINDEDCSRMSSDEGMALLRKAVEPLPTK